MAKSNGIRFFLFVSFFTFAILRAQGEQIKLTCYDGATNKLLVATVLTPDEKGEIDYNDQMRLFSLPLQQDTIKAIFYVVSYERYAKIMAFQYQIYRKILRAELAKKQYELFYLRLGYSDGDQNRIIDENMIRGYISNYLLFNHESKDFSKDFCINIIAAGPIKKATVSSSENTSPKTRFRDFEEVDIRGQNLMQRLNFFKIE